MNKHLITSAVFLATLACGATATAGDIRKCVSAEGRITLTDDACPGDTRSAKIIVAQEAAPEPVVTVPAPRAEPAARAAFAPLPARYVNLARRTKATGGLSLDTETLRSARIKMNVVDSLRGQRMASLQ